MPTASQSETGHAVNISNYKKMIDLCTSMGIKYNPTNPKLVLGNMTPQWTAADTANDALSVALESARIPIAQRIVLFEPLDKLITKSLNSFQSMDVSNQLKKDVKGIADDIRGVTHPTPTADTGNPGPGGTPPNPDPDAVSQSHQSYVQKVAHFKNYIDLLTAAGYAPNETDINLAALNALYMPMKAANDNIGNILAPGLNARIVRNHLLYDESTGIVDVAEACKKYVSSVFGAKAPETKLISGIKFRRNPK